MIRIYLTGDFTNLAFFWNVSQNGPQTSAAEPPIEYGAHAAYFQKSFQTRAREPTSRVLKHENIRAMDFPSQKGESKIMKAISQLSDSELLDQTRSLVGEERKVMGQVLEHLREIEGRRLYAQEGYSSLFDYCLKALNYSESEAFHRINSMRLIKQLPEMKAKLEAGSYSVSTLSLAQSVFRKEKEKFQSVEQKQELLTRFEGQSKRACERIVADLAPQALYSEREKALSLEVTELRLPLSSELLGKLKKLQALTGKSSCTELLELLVDEALKKKDPKHNPRLKDPVAPFEVKTRAASVPLKRLIQKRDRYQCTWVHEKSGKRCEATKYLELDHIQPWSLGGATSAENLRLLCTAHHGLVTTQLFGEQVTI